MRRGQAGFPAIDERYGRLSDTVPDGWKAGPAKLRQKDRDARWTLKHSRAKPKEETKPAQRNIASPVFGSKDHASMDRRHGFIRGWSVTRAQPAAQPPRHHG